MRALRSFTVRAKLPAALESLHELAMNLRWSWDERTRDLFRWVDPDTWEQTGHDPLGLLGLVPRERFEALSNDTTFLAFLNQVHSELQLYMEDPHWFQNRPTSPLRAVAYLSPEFGIAEALPQYSGGLGVLAGDHLKAASDLGVPLTGIGLFYRQGYFRQELNADGWQQERYPVLDPHAMSVTLCEGKQVEVELAGNPLIAQIWRAQVGRVSLYLLDADIDANDEEGRLVTDRLYGGGTEHRIRQEILLGMGGVRALEVLGEQTQVFHTNEGHAGFLGLERIRGLMTVDGLNFREAVEAVRAGTIFTTHTPVSAGIDLFPRELMERYFKKWADECDIRLDDLMALGHFPKEPVDAPFNMAVMGLHLAGMSNGVSKLHGEVSRSMFCKLWPTVPVKEVPITSVTNGVHASTWVSPEMSDVLSRTILPGWNEAGAETWERIRDARDDELWRAREQGRERLVWFARARLRSSLLGRGLSEADVEWCNSAFDPRILTLCFARRFATYKRATLLLSQPDRLKTLLLSAERPMQLLFAGKAHPADDKGKEIIKELIQFSSDPAIRHRIGFIEDYDIAVARTMYQGADVWLNNPLRPQEACGTSGEKAALNGALNCSILDGWWDEMFDGENGWAIASAETYEDLEQRNHVEASSLFDVLERQVVPLYYDRTQGPVPHRWIAKIKASLASLGPQVEASRMVRDYVQELYEPIAGRSLEQNSDNNARARALAGWKERVRHAWKDVEVVSTDSDITVAELGARRNVRAEISIGSLSADDIAVQLVHGRVGPGDELVDTSVVNMTVSKGSGDSKLSYEGTFSCERAGRYGFNVRVLPHHPDLLTPAEMGVAAWA